MFEVNKIYNEDCLIGMRNIEDNFVDLIVTSPPYNIKIEYGTHNDEMPTREYFDWLIARLKEMYRICKDGGRLCLNLPEYTSRGMGVWNIWQLFPRIISETGWVWRNTHIWYKPNHEGGSAWGSFNSPSCPYTRPDYEFILVFYKNNKKLQDKGKSDLTKEEFSKFTKSVWSFPGKVKINCKGINTLGHDAPFPEELPYRCIKLYSWIGALVFDPFIGTGTTARVSIDTKRNFLGFENDVDYFAMANNRIMENF